MNLFVFPVLSSFKIKNKPPKKIEYWNVQVVHCITTHIVKHKVDAK